MTHLLQLLQGFSDSSTFAVVAVAAKQPSVLAGATDGQASFYRRDRG